MKSITRSQPSLVQSLLTVSISLVILGLTAASGYLSSYFGLIEIWPVNAFVAAAVIRLCQKYCFRLYFYIFLSLFLGYLISVPGQYFAFANAISDFLSIAVVVYVLQYRLTIDNLRNHNSMIKVLSVGALAALVHSLVLAISSYGFGHINEIKILSDLLGQWLGFSALLPLFLLLHLPVKGDEKRKIDYKKIISHVRRINFSAPLITLVLSFVLYALIGMPGASIFVLAALLYCTYFYEQTVTAFLVFVSTVITVIISHNIMLQYMGQIEQVEILHIRLLLSMQLGMQTIVALPLLVSSTLAYRSDQIKALNKALDHDDLTKAMSRQAFMRGATELIRKTPPPLYGNAVLMLDIDFFKQLNDTHGHAAGDIVLMEFARAIAKGIRPDDLFGRLGGEEFGLVFPNTTLENAMEVAERLRQSVQRIELYYDSDEPLRITVSIGITHNNQSHGDKMIDLLSLADQAMYQAKNTGRNRICVFESSQD